MNRIIATFITLLLTAAPVWSKPLFETYQVFTPEGYMKPHGASMVELKNGNILATWFAGKEEGHAEAKIISSVWDRATGKWSASSNVVPADYSKSVGNTCLFRDDDGIIWMFFASVKFGGWSGAMTDYVQSHDEGKTWTEGKNLVLALGNLPRNPPIKTGDHKILLPLFVDFMYELNLVGSYTAIIEYKNGKILSKTYAELDNHNAIQPAVVKLKDGRILLLARDKSGRFVRRSYSNNNGKTWGSVDLTELPNPDSALAAIIVEELDAVLVAYNHSHLKRNPLSLAISTDYGQSFSRVADLEFKPGNLDTSFSYPAILRSSDGFIHLLWSHDNRKTIKHARFNLQWLMEVIKNPKIMYK